MSFSIDSSPHYWFSIWVFGIGTRTCVICIMHVIVVACSSGKQWWIIRHADGLPYRHIQAQTHAQSHTHTRTRTHSALLSAKQASLVWLFKRLSEDSVQTTLLYQHVNQFASLGSTHYNSRCLPLLAKMCNWQTFSIGPVSWGKLGKATLFI